MIPVCFLMDAILYLVYTRNFAYHIEIKNVSYVRMRSRISSKLIFAKKAAWNTSIARTMVIGVLCDLIKDVSPC